MGMDISGKNPVCNKSMEEFPTLMKWDSINWGDRNTKEWEKEQEQYWKEEAEYNKTNVGVYFRNNCWWWRPLWNFCGHHCPELIDEETYLSGHHNDGAGLNAEDSVKLGTKLLALIEDGTAEAHEKEIILSNEEAMAKDPDNSLAGAYPFSVDNVKEFANFCIQSGGFEIW